MLATTKEGDRRQANGPDGLASEFAFYNHDGKASFSALGNSLLVHEGKDVGLHLLQLRFLSRCAGVDGGKFLPDALAAGRVITMNLHHLQAGLVPIGKGVVASIPWRLFPSHHWSQHVPDLSTVCRGIVMPTGVGTIFLVDGEIIVPACGTHELA